MSARAAELVRGLVLKPHPEGGHYRELHRSDAEVEPLDGRGRRSALTGIWFLMVAGERSAWHRVESDEIWIHLEGGPVRLWTFDAETGEIDSQLLGPIGDGSAPQRAVRRGLWQAAEPLGDYSLTGAAVGPGFDFADFRLLAEDPEAEKALREVAPELLHLA